MPERWTVFSATCPSRQSLARIANKWTAMIVILLAREPLRFGELYRQIDGISKKVITDTLRALERDGLVERTRAGEIVHYRLTPLGETLHDPLRALQQWAEAHMDDVFRAREHYDRGGRDRPDSAVEPPPATGAGAR